MRCVLILRETETAITITKKVFIIHPRFSLTLNFIEQTVITGKSHYALMKLRVYYITIAHVHRTTKPHNGSSTGTESHIIEKRRNNKVSFN